MSCDDCCTPAVECPSSSLPIAAEFEFDLSRGEGAGTLTVTATDPATTLAIIFAAVPAVVAVPTQADVPQSGWLEGVAGLPLSVPLELPVAYGPASLFAPDATVTRWQLTGADGCTVELLLFVPGDTTYSAQGSSGPVFYSLDLGATWVEVPADDPTWTIVVDTDAEGGGQLDCPAAARAVPVVNGCDTPLQVEGSVTVTPSQLVELDAGGNNVVAAATVTELSAVSAGAVAVLFSATGAADGEVLLQGVVVLVNGPSVLLTAPPGFSLPELSVSATGGATDAVSATWATLVP